MDLGVGDGFGGFSGEMGLGVGLGFGGLDLGVGLGLGVGGGLDLGVGLGLGVGVGLGLGVPEVANARLSGSVTNAMRRKRMRTRIKVIMREEVLGRAF